MFTDFIPRQTDELVKICYPSGKTLEEKHLRNEAPANGWSRKTFFENGNIELHECYSNSMIIEQLFYNAEGEITAHKIYSHAQKKLIDKPKVTELRRPNVVTGYAHMGFYFRHLPAISQFVGAAYSEAELKKAYYDFIDSPLRDEELEERNIRWGIAGKDMYFSIWFERGESYYYWQLGANDEAGYKKAKHFMEQL